MKRAILVGIFLNVLFSCKKETATAPKVVVPTEPVIEECYRGFLNKDTFLLSIHRQGNEVRNGKLEYRFFEKDKSAGTLVGQIKGDTLFAAYSFVSEGKPATREVAFLKKGDTYTEGFGDVADDNHGNITFKDTKKLGFDGKVVLTKSKCN